MGGGKVTRMSWYRTYDEALAAAHEREAVSEEA
jgi:hypothetical protein